jgi:hypothetical protein
MREMAEGFAAVPTWMIRDKSVSSHAILVYASLASRGGLEAVVPSKRTIADEARCSLRTVAYALAELEQLGVLDRIERKGKGGARVANEYVLSNRPRAHAAPGRGADGAGAPCRERQSIPLIEVDTSEVDIQSASAPDAPQAAPLGFDEWWVHYPLKKDKGKARRAWSVAIKKAAPATLIAAAIAYRNDPNRVPAFTKYPASWLNAEAWENGPLPQRASGGGTAVERMAERARAMQAEGVRRELGA